MARGRWGDGGGGDFWRHKGRREFEGGRVFFPKGREGEGVGGRLGGSFREGLGEAKGFFEGCEVSGFVGRDEGGGKDAVAEVGGGVVEGEECGAEGGDFGGREGGADGKDMGGDGALLGEFAEAGTVGGREMVWGVEDVVADGGSFNVGEEELVDGGSVASAEPDVAATEEELGVGVRGEEAAADEVGVGNEVARGAGAAGEGDGFAAEVFEGLVGGIVADEPVAVVGGAALDFADEEGGGDGGAAGVEHVKGAKVSKVNSATSEAFEDDSGSKRNDHLHRARKVRREEVGKLATLGKHAVGVFVGF